MMTSLASLARALGGDVVGRQVLAPGPGHSRKDRSLSIMLSPSAPDGFLCFTHSPKDDPLEAKDFVRQRLGLPAFQSHSPRSRLEAQRLVVKTEPRTPAADDVDAKRRTAAALDIWNGSQDPQNTLVEKHLASRGLELPWQVAGETIRFSPRCPWRDEETNCTIYVPAMVAAMRSIANNEITAVHRTRLTPDGHKVDRRMLGPSAGAAIMLCPYTALGDGVSIGEGIETCLAGWMLGWSNAWALGSVGSIASFPLITGINAITVFAETDDTGASAKAIDAVGNRYADDGREVFLVTPTMPGDLNDVVRSATR